MAKCGSVMKYHTTLFNMILARAIIYSGDLGNAEIANITKIIGLEHLDLKLLFFASKVSKHHVGHGGINFQWIRWVFWASCEARPKKEYHSANSLRYGSIMAFASVCLEFHRHVELWSLQWNRVGLHNPFSRFRIQVFLMLVVGFHATSFSKNVSSLITWNFKHLQAFSLVSSTSTGCIMFGRLGAAGDDRPRLRWIPHQGSYSELFSALVLASIPWQWKHQRDSESILRRHWTDLNRLSFSHSDFKQKQITYDKSRVDRVEGGRPCSSCRASWLSSWFQSSLPWHVLTYFIPDSRLLRLRMAAHGCAWLRVARGALVVSWGQGQPTGHNAAVFYDAGRARQGNGENHKEHHRASDSRHLAPDAENQLAFSAENRLALDASLLTSTTW